MKKQTGAGNINNKKEVIVKKTKKVPLKVLDFWSGRLIELMLICLVTTVFGLTFQKVLILKIGFVTLGITVVVYLFVKFKTIGRAKLFFYIYQPNLGNDQFVCIRAETWKEADELAKRNKKLRYHAPRGYQRDSFYQI